MHALDIRGRLERQPYGMVAGALGVGFVLGGGLFTRLAAGIFAVGLRLGLMAALPLLQDELTRVIRPPVRHSRSHINGETRS